MGCRFFRETQSPSLLRQSENGNGCEWGPAISIRSRFRVLKTRFTATHLEPEYDAAVVPEVALVVISTSKRIAEARQHKIKFRRPDRDGFAQRDVDSPANDEIPSIVAWIPTPYADAWVHADIVLQILVKIGVGSSEHRRYERLEMLSAVFQNRAYVIGKEIAAGLDSATSRAWTIGDCGESKGPGE